MRSINGLARLCLAGAVGVACAGGGALAPTSGGTLSETPSAPAATVPSATPTHAPTPAETAIATVSSPSGSVCAGPDNDWSRFPALVRRYGDAWNAEDERTRRAALDEIWAEDGYYVDPFVEAPVIGRTALVAHMAYAMGPGHYVEVSAWTDADVHHDRVRIRWRHCCPTGALLLEGVDVGEIASDGRLQRVTSFWNTEVERPADVACD